MNFDITHTTRTTIGPYFYVREEREAYGEKPPRDAWCSYERGVREGELRVIGAGEYIATFIGRRGCFRAPVVHWRLKSKWLVQ